MRETRDILQAEHAARALNGMRGAENRVEQLGIEGTLVQAQESGLHFRQMFGGLLEERFAKTVKVYLHGGLLSLHGKTRAMVPAGPTLPGRCCLPGPQTQPA